MDQEKLDQVERHLRDRISSNDANVDEITVQPKGRGVWLAKVRLEDYEGDRFAVVTEDELS